MYMCGKLKDLDTFDPHRMIDYSLEKGRHLGQNVATTLAKKFGLPNHIVQAAQEFLKKEDLCGKDLHSE